MSRRWFLGLVFVMLAVTTLGVGVGTVAGQPSDCEPVDDQQLCIDEFDTPEQLVVNESVEFSLTLTNYGNESTTATVYLHTADPNNETADYELEEVTLDPDESTTLSRPIDASTPGVHGLRISVVGTESRDVFDVSDIATVEILEEHPPELGGPIDRTEIALGVLVLAMACIAGLGYRIYRRR
ncbi:MAG: hypothetical protein ACOCY6_03460 [Halodesulfurarchaeum sp.]